MSIPVQDPEQHLPVAKLRVISRRFYVSARFPRRDMSLDLSLFLQQPNYQAYFASIVDTATSFSYFPCFEDMFCAVPLKIIYFHMAAMTHCNSSRQPHQDVGFIGMSMILVSLEPKTTERTQFPFGALQMCLYLCIVLCH